LWSQSVTLNWKENKSHSFGYQRYELPFFENGFNTDGQKVFYIENYDFTGSTDSQASVLTVRREIAVQPEELGDLAVEEIPLSLEYRIADALSRKRKYTQVFLNPFYRRDGRIYKVISFDLEFAKASNPQTKSNTTFRNSILATGDWYRFEVDQTGLHRVTRSFLEDLGMNLSGIDPSTIKIYGTGGRSLPLLNSETIDYDPPEIQVLQEGFSDGSFDSSDAIYFYAEATDTELVAENLSHINPYSDVVYYYVTSGGAIARQIDIMVEPTGSPSVVYDYYHDVQFIENDEINLGNYGRRWFGNRFDVQPNQSYSFDFTDVRRDVRGQLTFQGAIRSAVLSNLSITTNTGFTTSFTRNSGDGVGVNVNSRRSTFFDRDDVQVDLSFSNPGDPSAAAFIDYLRLEVPVALQGTGSQFDYQVLLPTVNTGVSEYVMSSATEVDEIWEITDRFNITRKPHDGSSQLRHKADAAEEHRFLSVVLQDAYIPERSSSSRVQNQNLKGTILTDASGNFRDLDYLIVTDNNLRPQAQRLAAYHSTQHGLTSEVVTLSEIYREFSEGRQDISAIRNFVKYIYDNASTPTRRLKYLNLFGETSFDYKDRINVNELVVPSWHALESFSETNSYVVDEFFTYMDPSEGRVATNDLPDIAVGRMLVLDNTDARAMVDKAIGYDSRSSLGLWRNRVSLIADDIDERFDADIQEDMNTLSNQIEANVPNFNVNKIYLDSYNQVNGAGGERYPEAVEDIENSFEQGALVVNYLGHGNEDGLAREFVITQSLVDNLFNPDNLPLLMTVTCEFTRFDNPLRVSGGELAYKNEQGGAVALITTNRLITIRNGLTLNKVFDQYVFNYNNSEPISMAEAMRRAKTDPVGFVPGRRVVSFIGDPALELALPEPEVVLTAINDVLLTDPNVPELQALSRVKFSGEVRDLRGALESDYNGVVSATVYDKPITRTTLGNDGFEDSNNQLITITFEELGNVIFRGDATATNGRFEFEFIVPRDIQIATGNGRVSFYARPDMGLEDQNGNSEDIIVGGINPNAPDDDIGPEIDLYMNDTNFVSGGLTSESPFLLALLSDDSGINTTAGIGHDISAILDGNEIEPFILNDYYKADQDTFMSGQVYFPLRDIEPGLHTLTVKAWDTYNNSSTQEIQFLVAEDDDLKLERVLNYPNPFSSYTEFWFNHNRPFEPLDVNVQIMTVTGKVVYSNNASVTTDGFTSRELTWDGRDDFGQRLAKGVYLYKITVKSTLSDQTASKIEKLVIL